MKSAEEPPAKPTENSQTLGSHLGKTLVLTKSEFLSYGGAFYQLDFLDELSKVVPCTFFGPGFPNYDALDTLEVVTAKIGFVPDTIVVAHMWLDDNPLRQLDPMPNLGIRNFRGRKIGILNKEYSRLPEKLKWFAENRFQRCFSHSHRAPEFSSAGGPDYYFLPFGVSERFVSTSSNFKSFDLGFTGILQNPTFKDMQSDLRFSIMRDLFHTWRDVPLRKKKEWRDFRILWRSWSGDKTSDQLSRFIPWRRRLNPLNYKQALTRSRVWLNTISPAGLVSTRYFECMASGTLVLTERAPQLSQIFPEGRFLDFGSLGEFREKLLWARTNPSEVSAIAKSAREVAVGKHLWKYRVREFIQNAGPL